MPHDDRRVHCYTSFTYSYLDRARVLIETLRRFHPEWVVSACIADELPADIDLRLDLEGFDRIYKLGELDIADKNLRSWIFSHSIVELSTAVKGPVLQKLFDEEQADKVIYLDPDIAVFAPLDEIVGLLDHHPVVLTPHVLEPEDERLAILDNEIGSLKFGVYNLGFLAVRNCPEGRRFAGWWRNRLLDYCYHDIAGGLFTDQRWCDLAPAFFPDLKILRGAGYNVASWNLGRRPISIGDDGVIRAGGESLRFFHFTKVAAAGERMLRRYAGDRIEVFELIKWYNSRREANRLAGLPPNWWAYATFASGQPISRSQRVTYRSRPDLQSAFPDPFLSGEGTYEAWFSAHESQVVNA
jgi:hypothetical protein